MRMRVWQKFENQLFELKRSEKEMKKKAKNQIGKESKSETMRNNKDACLAEI